MNHISRRRTRRDSFCRKILSPRNFSVIASKAKQSRISNAFRDCFVALLLAMTCRVNPMGRINLC